MGFSVTLHLHNVQISECRSFSACLQIYHHPSHKISMETRPRKVSLNSWILFFFIEWKKVFEINSWTGYHLMNMSNITHDFLEIAAVAVVFVYWMIFFYRKAPVRIRYLFSMFLELLTFLILVVLPLFDIYTWWVISISLPCFSWL